MATPNEPNTPVGLGNVACSLIRTWTPIAVGALITWLSGIGIDLSAEHAVGLSAAATAILGGAYYALIRSGERGWP